MNQLQERFESLRKKGEAALIAFVTGGDPSMSHTVDIVEAMIEGGADIVELGLPFSDPIADGPTIQAANMRALAAGATPKNMLETVRKIKSRFDIPVIILTYYNPVFRMENDFIRLAKASGVDGLAVADLPVEEAGEYKMKVEKYGLDTVFFAAPSTSKARLSKIVEYSSGFIYLISVFGVTGARANIQNETVKIIREILPSTRGRVPLAVGFGISKAEHVKIVSEIGVDGVIAGSVFVNLIEKNLNNKSDMLAKIKAKTCELKSATHV